MERSKSHRYGVRRNLGSIRRRAWDARWDPLAQHEDSLQYTFSEGDSSLSLRHRRGNNYIRSEDMAYSVDRNWAPVCAVLYRGPDDQLACRGWTRNLCGGAQPAARGVFV